jgi:predicted transcriptional regulator
MHTLTPEKREDLILNVLNVNADGVGFNKLQKETSIPRKTLARYLRDMKSENKIGIEKDGKRRNGELCITVNFSPKSKEAIQHNLDVTLNQHWTRYKTKIQKANVFPHFLQLIAAEYYDYLMINLFEGSALYKFALNRLEENLQKERKLIEKEFTPREIVRLYEECEELGMYLFSSAISSINNAAYRKKYRTSDEISRDAVSVPELHPVESTQMDQDQHDEILDDLRADLIKDNETKTNFVKLAREYNKLAHEIEKIKSQMAFLVGTYPLGSEFINKNHR